MPVAADNLTALRQRLETARAAFDDGRIGEAAQSYRDIVNEVPDQPDALYMLAAIAYRMGKIELSLELYDETLKVVPTFSLAWSNRAVILRVLGREDDALEAGRKAIANDPKNAGAWDIVGLLLREKNQLAASLQHHARAQGLDPRSQHIQNNYAVALLGAGRVVEAYKAAKAAARLDPAYAVAELTLGNVYGDAGWPEKAIEHYRRAIEIDPAFTKPIASEGRTLMLMGDLAPGWEKMETRDYDAQRFSHLPRWHGEKIHHLILCAEQGVGDIIHFLRYIPLIRDRVEKISIEVPASMQRLVSAYVPDSLVVTPDEPLPEGDAFALLMSLPHICKTVLDNIPAQIPYIRADETSRAFWREKLSHLPHPRIGIVWMGNALYANDHNRSLDVAQIAPLFAAGRQHFVSLQKGTTTATKANAGIFDAEPWLNDFIDTAGLIAELDLVIAVDTGLAHLAGAMGKPVWTFIPFLPDWRWMLGREDTPWYPTMRLFRQQAPKDWRPVIERITAEARKFIAGDRTVLIPPRWDGKIQRKHPAAISLPEGEF